MIQQYCNILGKLFWSNNNELLSEEIWKENHSVYVMYVTISCFSVLDPEIKKVKIEDKKQSQQQPDVKT